MIVDDSQNCHQLLSTIKRVVKRLEETRDSLLAKFSLSHDHSQSFYTEHTTPLLLPLKCSHLKIEKDIHTKLSSQAQETGRGRRSKRSSLLFAALIMHLSMLSPRGGGGGGTPGICGAFDLFCLPHPWEFD